jgi:hypothetical protein
MSIGNAASAAANTTVPVTTTGRGQALPAITSVHHGTPKRSSRIAVMVSVNRRTRPIRRRGRASTASPTDTGKA